MSSNSVLAEFASLFRFCAVCWQRNNLHVHHLQQGAGRVHDRRVLLRLCVWCHQSLHMGGQRDLHKGHCLTAKRETDSGNYDPEYLASLRRKRHLGYGPMAYPAWVAEMRLRNGMPQELTLMNSRRKGKTGELEAAAELNAVLPRAMARRSQQHSGTESSSDLIAPGLPGLWLEVKRVQHLNLSQVMRTSMEQCGSLTPVVLHRKNNEQWMVTFPLSQVREFARAIQEAQ